MKLAIDPSWIRTFMRPLVLPALSLGLSQWCQCTPIFPVHRSLDKQDTGLESLTFSVLVPVQYVKLERNTSVENNVHVV